MKEGLPEFFQKVTKKYPGVWKHYEKLGEALKGMKGLDARSQALVKLGVSIGAKLEGAVHSHTRRCKAMGITDEEIYHAALLGVTTIGWPSAMASISWIDDILKGLNKQERA